MCLIYLCQSLKFCNYFLECSIVIMSIVREESAPAACQTISDMRIFYELSQECL